MLRSMTIRRDTRVATLTLLALLFVLRASAAAAVSCGTIRVRDTGLTVCRVELRQERLHIYYADPAGRRYENFESLRVVLAHHGEKLLFAMNAGMFDPDFRPVGLLVIDGREIAPINRAQGTGNFYLQPNGVLLIDGRTARVLATDEHRGFTPAFATQSGPMLVHHGQISDSAAFRALGSRRIRNGVCAPAPETVVFVISDTEVTLREFALYFQRGLECSEALYLDGSISSLYAPQLRCTDARAPLGPMVGVSE